MNACIHIQNRVFMENKSFVSITKVNGYINDTLRGGTRRGRLGWVGGVGGGVVYCIFVLLPTYTIKNTTLSVKPQERNGKKNE